MKKPILSVDIALNNLGWVVFEDGLPWACGVVQPLIPKEMRSRKGKNKLSKREENTILLRQLIDGFNCLLDNFHPVSIVGEAPHGGAKSADAAVKMNMALAVVMSVCLVRVIDYQWCSPNDVKRETIGDLKASKEQIMDWTIEKFGGEKDVKEISITKGKRAGKVDRRLTYSFLGKQIPGGMFEHIADAAGAYWAVNALAATK